MHGHHIVFKRGLGAAGQAASKEAKDILLYYGIDPYFGQENLVYAPNQGHPDAAIVYMCTELRTAFNNHLQRSGIVDKLRQFAEKYIERQLPGMANAPQA